MKATLILASASPRRRRLLEEAGFPFRALVPRIDETPLPGELPAEYVRRLARRKAEVVGEKHPRALVIGADTVVVLDGTIYGKPASLAEARVMLARLAGRTHRVLTGVCLCRSSPPLLDTWVSETRVTFRAFGTDTIEQYCRLVDPLDRAGSYGLREHGEMLVAGLEGLRSTVIGLPVEELIARHGPELPRPGNGNGKGNRSSPAF